MGANPIDLVRGKTTGDTEWLPDSIIEMYLEEYPDDWRLAAVECLLYMARDDVYEQYRRGGIQVAKPLLRERAVELRNLVLSEVGATVTASTLSRGETVEDLSAEYNTDHSPYTYGAGFVKTVKAQNGA